MEYPDWVLGNRWPRKLKSRRYPKRIDDAGLKAIDGGFIMKLPMKGIDRRKRG